MALSPVRGRFERSIDFLEKPITAGIETEASTLEKRPDEPIHPLKLEDVLQQHELWLSSGGQEGSLADLSGANLEGTDLAGVNLQRADLQKANLKKAVLSLADLRGALLFHQDYL